MIQAMRLSLLAVLVVLAGCNSLLGIEDVSVEKTVATDTDGDGIPDSIDNCPLVPNPDQADSDGDGIGNACDACGTGIDADHDGTDDGCDPCLKGPQVDEDGDGIYDACDDCPGIPDPAQSDSDGDTIGDACDLVDGGLPQRRIVFDAFAPPIGPWVNVWDVANGAVTPPAAQLPMARMTLTTGQVMGNVTGDWYFLASVTLPASAPANSFVGFELPSAQVVKTFRCGFAFNGTWTLQQTLAFAGRPVSAGTPLLLRASYVVAAGGNETGIRCEVLDGTTAPITTTDPLAARDVRFSFYADVAAQFGFVDFVGP
ncbi:MAG: thrombospondin type 3 repeat-containing protein [Deltaproteobacteria bacterium]|nr:thrombospondin type 3 repeat-containing protein [Deltaproteobacteria bacterium]